MLFICILVPLIWEQRQTSYPGWLLPMHNHQRFNPCEEGRNGCLHQNPLRWLYREMRRVQLSSISGYFYKIRRQNIFEMLKTNEVTKNYFIFFVCFSIFFYLCSQESTYKKCLREEWGKFTGYQLLSSFWLKVARTDEDGNTTSWDRGTLPIRNLYPKWGMLRFGRMRKVTNWIWTLWFIVSY